jgi:hypothetical protein
MDNIEIADYFGHKTEAEFLDWAVGQFKERADIDVKDKGEISYLFAVIDESDGCGCDSFDWQNVRVELKLDDMVIVYTGVYSADYEESEVLALDRPHFSHMGKVYPPDTFCLRI